MKAITHAGRGRQTGMALVVALLLLVVISLIGVAAMRTSIFNTKISTSAQGSIMAFQAAESALAALFTGGLQFTEAALARRIVADATPVEGCVTADNVAKGGACGTNDFIDQRDLLQASWRLVAGPTMLIDLAGEDIGGFQISTSGGEGSLPADCTFTAVGEGRFAALNIENYNVQEFARRCFLIPEG
jgi:type IV pilus assembly protein PilX